MEIEIDALALENWYDLLSFLSRGQLGQLASSIGNRRFASIVQTFLHKYVRQITLRSINVLETTTESANERSIALVDLWTNGEWGREEFPLPNWPIPENITNFQSIKLSYLDFSVLRFLHILQQNSLFTDVHLRITRNDFYEIVKMLFHLLPLIVSIDSLELEGTDLIDVINKENGDETSEMLARMMDRARVLELFTVQDDGQLNRLYRWLNTPMDDRKARVLLFFDCFINNSVMSFMERLKMDFLAAKETVTYFVGMQSPFLSFQFGPYFRAKSLTNSQTNERMTCKMPDIPRSKLLLISRYPLDAAQEWIDASEKEIVEWKTHKRSRKIEFGLDCAIGPMEPPPPPSVFQKLLSIFH